MFAALARRATGVHATALVEKTLVGWPRTRLAFDVYLDFPDWRATDSPIAIATIGMGSSGARTGTVFFVDDTDGSLSVESEPSASRYFNPPATVVSGRWTQVVLDFDPYPHLHNHRFNLQDEARVPPDGAGAWEDAAALAAAARVIRRMIAMFTRCRRRGWCVQVLVE